MTENKGGEIRRTWSTVLAVNSGNDWGKEQSFEPKMKRCQR